mgnify:CR=1 FL=1
MSLVSYANFHFETNASNLLKYLYEICLFSTNEPFFDLSNKSKSLLIESNSFLNYDISRISSKEIRLIFAITLD